MIIEMAAKKLIFLDQSIIDFGTDELRLGELGIEEWTFSLVEGLMGRA